MVELDSLDSSPFRDEIPVFADIKSSTPADNKPCPDGDMRTPDNPPPIRSSASTRPRPLFRDEPVTFSTKKERRRSSLGFKPPPRPPAKSCPPKSRIFKSNALYKAQAVTFLDSPDGRKPVGSPLNPKLYDTKIKKSYFQQAFSIESEIGAGYFGTVFRVRSKEDGKLYAVKIANEKYKGYSDRDRKLEEVRKHQFLPLHSNLVKFISSWEEEGRLYQQFELCKGNLQSYCEKNNTIAETLVWGYLVDLLQAVQHLHNHDLVHMDIKPDNIFFGFDGRCKLGDFGLIVDLINQQKDGLREGDSKYLAPEVLKGNISKSCDIFSLGITILEVACDLDLPSKGQLWSDLRNRGPDPSLTLAMSPELRRVVQLMMTQDPDRRPGVNQILELPSVAKAVRRREREIFSQRCTEQLMLILRPLLHLMTWCLGLLETLWTRVLRSSAAPTEDQFTPTSELVPRSWAHDAYSDDEADCTVSSAGSDLAAPLQDTSHSSSNENSSFNSSGKDEVFKREASPVRRPWTSPGLRSRARCAPRTPFNGARTELRNFAGTPQKRLFLEGLEESPTQNLMPNLDDSGEEEELQLSVQPQSLVKTFDCFSDDE